MWLRSNRKDYLWRSTGSQDCPALFCDQTWGGGIGRGSRHCWLVKVSLRILGMHRCTYRSHHTFGASRRILNVRGASSSCQILEYNQYNAYSLCTKGEGTYWEPFRVQVGSRFPSQVALWFRRNVALHRTIVPAASHPSFFWLLDRNCSIGLDTAAGIRGDMRIPHSRE